MYSVNSSQSILTNEINRNSAKKYSINLLDPENFKMHAFVLLRFMWHFPFIQNTKSSHYENIIRAHQKISFQGEDPSNLFEINFLQNIIIYYKIKENNKISMHIYIIEMNFNSFLNGDITLKQGSSGHIVILKNNIICSVNDNFTSIRRRQKEKVVKISYHGEFKIKQLFNEKEYLFNSLYSEFNLFNIYLNTRGKTVNNQPFLFEMRKNNVCSYVYSLMFMPYIKGETLKDHLENDQNKKNHEQNFKIFLSILNEVEKIHKIKIVHGDLYQKNIIIKNHDDIKDKKVTLIDFGSGGKIGKQVNGFFYPDKIEFFHFQLAPELIKIPKNDYPNSIDECEEVIEHTLYQPSIDVFALGGLFLSMTLRYPYVNDITKVFNNIEVNDVYNIYYDFEKIFPVLIKFFSHKIPTEVYYFIINYCININPEERITVDNIINILLFYQDDILSNKFYLHSDVYEVLKSTYYCKYLMKLMSCINLIGPDISENEKHYLEYQQLKRSVKEIVHNHLFCKLEAQNFHSAMYNILIYFINSTDYGTSKNKPYNELIELTKLPFSNTASPKEEKQNMKFFCNKNNNSCFFNKMKLNKKYSTQQNVFILPSSIQYRRNSI